MRLEPITLTGRHVRLEPLTLDHAPSLLAAADRDRSTFGYTPVPDTIDRMSAYISALLADDSIGYVFTRMHVEMPMHPDWPASLDESNPVNFCLRRIWHDMILGFPEEPDFSTYRTEDTLYRMCLRRLVQHKKIPIETCEQFVSPGNALDRQRKKFSMSMAAFTRSKIDDGFVLTDQMKAVLDARMAHIHKLLTRT